MIDFVIDDEGDYESSMTGSDRRQEILKNIKESDRPVSGSKLAKDYDVSRQVIVQDIALLRASGYDIISTNRGYVLEGQTCAERVFKVRHTDEQLETELCTIVDLGGQVKNVMVNHKVYGHIEAELGITSRRKVKEFLVRDVYSILAKNVNPYNSSFEVLTRDLKRLKRNGYRVILLSGSRTRARRLAEDLRDYDLNSFYDEDPERLVKPGEILVSYGHVAVGYEYPMLKFTVISETDIFGKKKKKKRHLKL